MTMNEYQVLAQRTSNTEGTLKILNGVLGLTGEAGECSDIVKKHLFQGHEPDHDHLKEEIGDCLWYIAEVATGLGLSLDEVAKNNIHKLRQRYPNGFEASRSVNRPND